ncbi:DNA/RNA non-specific endonuclease [Mycetocola manganoxydans]|uniref:DNA/RNA non-specific endonuclease n=2 Tax=Mycetocola manganoxydans TaxID=699879 RepID=A0A3L6ZVM9_9MICO|nr:DNA/RNA non-specific endonuclease [Mycetocola manganoxydans]
MELDYTHFTVLLDTGRRLAAATAVNIDGTSLVDVPRGDDWHLDSRVAENEQAGPELYRRNDLDRGHLVRRRDPVWGAPVEAARANRDTFAYTNAAPQAAQFNQSKELWLGLEDYLLGYADATEQRLDVFTGSVLADDDPVYRGIGIPRAFWKVAAWTTPGDAPTLASTAYLLDQSPQLDEIDLTEARLRARSTDAPPPLGPFRTFQVPVRDLEEATGLDFGGLVAADRLERVQGIRPRAEGWVPLETFGDIRV